MHSKCLNKCSSLCDPCKERCAWNCEHIQCNKLCPEICDRKPCDRPCLKNLNCGHFCCGFCGEICPPLCKICDKMKNEFHGLKSDEQEQKFVYLEDCGHIIEVTSMDNSINKSYNLVKLPLCPKPECKKPIRRNFRFSSFIKRQLISLEKVKIQPSMKLPNSKSNF